MLTRRCFNAKRAPGAFARHRKTWTTRRRSLQLSVTRHALLAFWTSPRRRTAVVERDVRCRRAGELVHAVRIPAPKLPPRIRASFGVQRAQGEEGLRGETPLGVSPKLPPTLRVSGRLRLHYERPWSVGWAGRYKVGTRILASTSAFRRLPLSLSTSLSLPLFYCSLSVFASEFTALPAPHLPRFTTLCVADRRLQPGFAFDDSYPARLPFV
ncbi:hypothetical protein BD626DRAFT_224754 [Schizophyllum amplum]|uniref:Uncharacterized protein n=1 Tax=Schizophyllum amplum TaxID=97359 RepID=A0A550BX67_9AGAR|nr:hypothetical protein BD626DRAFT_224754 [Auriculariopsis ampla]